MIVYSGFSFCENRFTILQRKSGPLNGVYNYHRLFEITILLLILVKKKKKSELFFLNLFIIKFKSLLIHVTADGKSR